MLKVLNVLYDERLGGPQLRILRVGARLRDFDINTVICIPQGGEEFVHRLSTTGIKTYQIPLVRVRDTLSLGYHLKWIVYFWINIWQLLRIIREEDIDIVHTNGVVNLQGAIAAKLSGAQLVWHINDFAPYRIQRLCFPLVRILADEIAVSSESVGDRYFDGWPTFLKKDTYTLYAPVDVRTFTPLQNYNIREEFGIGRRSLLVGVVGNITPVKGYEYFIEAAAMTRERFPKSRFLIVGKKLKTRNKYFESLEARVKDLGIDGALTFAGQRDDIPDIMQALSIYVHTSTTEACPMAVLEAMATGRPIVATAVGGVPEVLGDAGVLVTSEDSEAIAEAVIALWENPERMRTLGRRARERVEEFFSLEKCVKRHKDLYEYLLEGDI